MKIFSWALPKNLFTIFIVLSMSLTADAASFPKIRKAIQNYKRQLNAAMDEEKLKNPETSEVKDVTEFRLQRITAVKRSTFDGFMSVIAAASGELTDSQMADFINLSQLPDSSLIDLNVAGNFEYIGGQIQTLETVLNALRKGPRTEEALVRSLVWYRDNSEQPFNIYQALFQKHITQRYGSPPILMNFLEQIYENIFYGRTAIFKMANELPAYLRPKFEDNLKQSWKDLIASVKAYLGLQSTEYLENFSVEFFDCFLKLNPQVATPLFVLLLAEHPDQNFKLLRKALFSGNRFWTKQAQLVLISIDSFTSIVWTDQLIQECDNSNRTDIAPALFAVLQRGLTSLDFTVSQHALTTALRLSEKASPDIRGMAVSLLGYSQLDETALFAKFSLFSKHAQPRVRQGAAMGLSAHAWDLKREEAKFILHQLYFDKDKRVSLAAREGLTNFFIAEGTAAHIPMNGCLKLLN